MTSAECDEYRKSIDLQIQEKFKEIDTNISYIIVGALGFFITMLDKFVDINNAFLVPLMVISFLSLLVSFFLFLYSKHLMANQAEVILKFVDDKLTHNPNDKDLCNELLNMWEVSNSKLNQNRNYTYIFLGIGVCTLVLFFTTNLFVSNKLEHKENVLKVIVDNKK